MYLIQVFLWYCIPHLVHHGRVRVVQIVGCPEPCPSHTHQFGHLLTHREFFIWPSQFSVPKSKPAFSQPKLLFHEVLHLSKGCGRLIVLFKSFHLVFYSQALRVVIPNLEVLISFPGFIAQKVNLIK